MFQRLKSKTGQRLSRLVVVLLIIELLDEWVFGIREAAWPLIRQDLQLDYAQIGLLMGLPTLFANMIEPIIGVWGDTGSRRRLILGGGIVFGLCLIGIAFSTSFALLLVVSMLWYPSSGAFVSLAQASLMDSEPERHEQNMARWTFAGAVGVLVGTLSVSICVMFGISWRWAFLLVAVMTAITVIVGWRLSYPQLPTTNEEGETVSLWEGLKLAFGALRRPAVLRWLVLLEFANLMLDVLLGYLALYLVDVGGVTEAQAAIGVTVWTGVGLLGDFLIIFLLERVRGLTYLRYSVLVVMALFPLFLLVPTFEMKLVVLALLGISNAGWYSILQGQLYGVMRGQSGAVMAVSTVTNTFGGMIPLAIGLLADQFGLGVAIWALMAGPFVLLIGVPWKTGLNTPVTQN